MKKIVSLIIALCLIFSFSITAFADGNPTLPSDETESVVEPRAEEVEWAFRIHNGNLEKRLWSNTYGKWLTDWIIIGPYPG